MAIDAEDLSTLGDGAAVAEPADVEPLPELVEEELLVEEISIDGMCGVY